MIYDSIRNCELYYGTNSKFKTAFDFIKKAVSEKLPAGKYEIDGSDVYAMVQEYMTKEENDGKYEAHRRYIDIQYITDGTERIDVVDISKAEVDTEYDNEIDAGFYKSGYEGVRMVLESDDFCIFFPHDTHKPALATTSSAQVKKIVVKVSV